MRVGKVSMGWVLVSVWECREAYLLSAGNPVGSVSTMRTKVLSQVHLPNVIPIPTMLNLF